jgi:signal transduction histidine kinase
MSLRVRLFLLLGGLVVLLVAAQWWFVRSLTHDLSGELGEVAVFVGQSVASSIVVDEEPEGTLDSTGADAGEQHQEGQPLEEHHVVQEYRIIKQDAGTLQSFRFSFHPSDKDRHAAGRIHMVGPHMEETIPIPRAGLNRKLDGFSRNLILGTFAILGLGLVLVGLVSYRVSTPLKELERATKTVGDGVLGTQVPVSASGEVGEALRSFNRMSQHLKELDDKARSLRERQHLTELGEVARGMAHTMRNPLNALGLSVEELATAVREKDAVEELVESVQRQIHRMDQAIRSFLVLADEGAAVEEPIDVVSLLQDVALETLQDSRGAVHIKIEETPLRPSLLGVQPELRSILHALTVNAIEASPDGGKVTIRIRKSSEERIRIEIDDEGPGLADEVKKHLFTPHVTTKANGTGMGLFLTHRIAVTRYEGSLELVDFAPRGTRAVLELSDRKVGHHA